MQYLFLILTLFFFQSCSNSTKPEQPQTTTDTLDLQPSNSTIFEDNFDKSEEIYERVFPWIMDSTFYKNPKMLIAELGNYYNQHSPEQTVILAYERHRLYGIEDSVWFINCKSTLPGYGCAFPSLNTQYLFDNQGKLIHKNQAHSVQFISMMPDSLPIYMSIDHDCNGEGQHHFYIYQHGKLIDIFNVLMNDTPKTFDSNPKDGMFQNKQLALEVKDVNADSFKDIILKGKWLDQAGKSNPVEYIFLYKPTKEYFLMENNNLSN